MSDALREMESTKLRFAEAKYELYHKDFSSAMQHAYHVAKKHHGITIDPKEIDDKVATGPSKPSEGKTNKYRLKGDKGAVQIQVYNKGGSKPFELNMYKEEVDLDEGTKQVLAHGGKGQYKAVRDGDITKIMYKGKVVGTADFDSGADSFFASIKGEKGQKSFDDAQAMVDYFAKKKITEEVDLDEGGMKDLLIRAQELMGPSKNRKEGIQMVAKGLKVSEKEATKLVDAVIKMNEEVDLVEGKMSQLHQYIKDKKSAEEIAKLMKVDVKTIKTLMSSNNPEDVEESAASDARRAMAKDKDFSRKDSADDDDDATDDDVKGASKNIIMQMRKAQSLNGRFPVEFADKKKVKIPAKMAIAVQQKYNAMKKPADKEKFQTRIGKSYKDMLSALKEELQPKKESILERMNRKIKENKDG